MYTLNYLWHYLKLAQIATKVRYLKKRKGRKVDVRKAWLALPNQSLNTRATANPTNLQK